MFGSACLLRFAVSLTIAISKLSIAAQDTPVDQTAKAPGSTAQPAATDTAALAKTRRLGTTFLGAHGPCRSTEA
jgi:HAMP domain-containing protein